MADTPDLMDFRLLEQRWGEYVLPNGIVVRGVPLISFIWPSREAKRSVNFRSHTLLSVSAPKHLKGPKASGPQNPLKRKVLEESKDFEVLAHGMSVYVLEGGAVMAVKMLPTVFKRTDAFDKEGEPILEVGYISGVVATPEALDPIDPEDVKRTKSSISRKGGQRRRKS